MPFAAGVLRRNKAQVAHQGIGRIKPPELEYLGNQRYGRQCIDALETPQQGDDLSIFRTPGQLFDLLV